MRTDSALACEELRARRRAIDEDARVHADARRVWANLAACSTRSTCTARRSRRAAASAGAAATFPISPAPRLDATGQPKSFLSSEDNYRYVKSLHEHNLIVPVSGDFAGPKAIRAIGTYLHDHAGHVSAFYVSNVEQYLFGDGHAQVFYENVATLPMDSSSVFIRPYSMRRGPGGPTRSLCPIAAFIQASQAGRVQDNNQALACIM